MARIDVSRGEVWRFGRAESSASGPGTAPAGSLGLVVQTNPANQNPRYGDTVVVPVSDRGLNVPFHVRLETGDTGQKPVYARCERIVTLPKEQLLDRVFLVGPQEMEKVGEALRLVLAL